MARVVTKRFAFFPVAGGGTLALLATFAVWTRHCRMDDLHSDDRLLRCRSYLKLNPTPVAWSEMRDVCTRRYSMHELRPELVEDARRGGTALIESFSQGVWGGSGYTFQRLLLRQFRGSLPETQTHLWTQQSLLDCKYDIDTHITDHLVVLEKTPRSIVFRAGGSPRYNPDSPREMDGLVELEALPDFERGHVDFKFKTAFFVGTGYKGAPGTKMLPWVVEWAHRQYTKAIVEAGLSRVRKNRATADVGIGVATVGGARTVEPNGARE